MAGHTKNVWTLAQSENAGSCMTKPESVPEESLEGPVKFGWMKKKKCKARSACLETAFPHFVATQKNNVLS
jgi:hypothetical protein